jgi:hypothetical protein
MPEISDDLPDARCFSLHSGSGIEENQSLAPDPFSPRATARARDGRGRFAKGHSGNPAGRPRGIPNPKRRVLTLQAWRANRRPRRHCSTASRGCCGRSSRRRSRPRVPAASTGPSGSVSASDHCTMQRIFSGRCRRFAPLLPRARSRPARPAASPGRCGPGCGSSAVSPGCSAASAACVPGCAP